MQPNALTLAPLLLLLGIPLTLAAIGAVGWLIYRFFFKD
jgi:hypothetical protein